MKPFVIFFMRFVLYYERRFHGFGDFFKGFQGVRVSSVTESHVVMGFVSLSVFSWPFWGLAIQPATLKRELRRFMSIWSFFAADIPFPVASAAPVCVSWFGRFFGFRNCTFRMIRAVLEIHGILDERMLCLVGLMFYCVVTIRPFIPYLHTTHENNQAITFP